MKDDEVKAIINTYLYKYYQDYVEPLEKEHDALLDKYIKLKKVEKEYIPIQQEDFTRLRNQNVKLLEKNKRLEFLLDQKDEEIKKLEEEIKQMKNYILKRGKK